MAFKPMSPLERASIEAQVILKAAVELAVAEVGNEPDGVAVTMAIENARVLAQELPNLKNSLVSSGDMEVAVAPSQDVVDVVVEAFPGTTEVASDKPVSKYIDDEQYALVHKIWLAEKSAGIAYASKDSMFLDNQAIRKLFQTGTRVFPTDYWAVVLQGKEIPQTKTGKCGLGDFKIKKSVNVSSDGVPFLGEGDGNHPLANKSGYFAGLVKNSPFNWGERPDPVDPQGWLAKANA
jgi:hypothetical protein|tara:strand:- start:10 stop:717 length:708 start_codon:yes stop_codon:yes gene_type:complete